MNVKLRNLYQTLEKVKDLLRKNMLKAVFFTVLEAFGAYESYGIGLYRVKYSDLMTCKLQT